jgi:hypothetical protein
MFMRPSPKEICNKVADALVALRAGRFQFGPLKHLSGDLAEMELDAASGLPGLLVVLLEEIKSAGPIECYAGTRPPQRSYEPETLKLELWAYRWHSPRFQKWMYLKFALKNQCYIHVGCHEDRPPERQL